MPPYIRFMFSRIVVAEIQVHGLAPSLLQPLVYRIQFPIVKILIVILIENIPVCWSKYVTGGYAYIFGSTFYSSPKSLCIATHSGSTSYYGFIRTNQLNIADFSNIQLLFKGRKFSGSTKPLVVGIMSDATDLSTITILDTIENMTSAWSDYTILLSSYTDTGKYVVIGVPAGIDEDCEYWIDDLVIDTFPSCIEPTNLSVTNIAFNSADFNWTEMGSATAWNIEYGLAGFSQGTGTTISTTNNPHTISGLTTNTTYGAYIQADCGNGDLSTWTGPISFTTAQGICEVPTNLTVSGITENSADVSWSAGGSETLWTLEYKTFSSANYNSVNCSNNSYTLNGLSPLSDYVIRVKAICGTDNESDYISANFTTDSAQVITYTITASAGDNGTISPSGTISIPQGGSQTFTISPDNGYHIQNVLVDNVSQGNTSSYTFSNVQGNHVISVSFSAQEITYTITASAGDNGTISPSGVISVSQGGSQTFTISPDNGYHIQDVLVDNVSQGDTSSYTFSNVQENHAISVSFIAGIKDNVLGMDVLIFPNPANNVLNVKSEQLFDRVEITNLLGQVLYNAKIVNSDFSINISSCYSGIYLVRLEGKQGIVIKKFVKK